MSIYPFGTRGTKLSNMQKAGEATETQGGDTRATTPVRRDVDDATVSLAGDVIGATTETVFKDIVYGPNVLADGYAIELKAVLREVTDNAADTGRIRVRFGPTTTALGSRAALYDSAAFDQDTGENMTVELWINFGARGAGGLGGWGKGFRSSTGAVAGEGVFSPGAGSVNYSVEHTLSITYESSTNNAAQVFELNSIDVTLKG